MSDEPMDGRDRDPQQDARGAAVAARIRALQTTAPEGLRRSVERAAAEAEVAQRAAPTHRGPVPPPQPDRPAAAAPSPHAARPPRRARAAGPRRGGRLHARTRVLVASAGALALVLAALLAIVLIGSGSGGETAAPSVPQLARVALREPTGPAPAAARAADRLAASVDGVDFPTWSAKGLRASGERADRLGDRDVRTVFYAGEGGERIGYAIAAGPALPRGGRYVGRDGVDMWVYDLDGAMAVMWERDGRTCVVAGRDVGAERLLTLVSARTA